jgi:hypothetical protein
LKNIKKQKKIQREFVCFHTPSCNETKQTIILVYAGMKQNGNGNGTKTEQKEITKRSRHRFIEHPSEEVDSKK